MTAASSTGELPPPLPLLFFSDAHLVCSVKLFGARMIFIHSIFLAEGRNPSDAAVMTKFEHEARIEGWLGWVYSCTHRHALLSAPVHVFPLAAFASCYSPPPPPCPSSSALFSASMSRGLKSGQHAPAAAARLCAESLTGIVFAGLDTLKELCMEASKQTEAGKR